MSHVTVTWSKLVGWKNTKPKVLPLRPRSVSDIFLLKNRVDDPMLPRKAAY